MINFNNSYEKVNMTIEEIAIRNAKKDNEYLVGQWFSLNHEEIAKDNGKDFTMYNGTYECIEVSFAWNKDHEYYHKLRLDDDTVINFYRTHLINQ